MKKLLIILLLPLFSFSQEDIERTKGQFADFTKVITNLIKNLDPNKNLDTDTQLFITSAYYARGISKFRTLEDYKGAIRDFTEVILMTSNMDPRIKFFNGGPNALSAYYKRGVSKFYLKDYNGAIKDYNKVIEFEPNFTEAYYNRAMAKFYLKDYKGAIADCTKAIEFNPNDADTYYLRAWLKDKLGDYKGAIADCTKAIEFNPNLARAYYTRAMARYTLPSSSEDRLIDEVCQDAHKAIELEPNYANASYLINAACN